MTIKLIINQVIKFDLVIMIMMAYAAKLNYQRNSIMIIIIMIMEFARSQHAWQLHRMLGHLAPALVQHNYELAEPAECSISSQPATHWYWWYYSDRDMTIIFYTMHIFTMPLISVLSTDSVAIVSHDIFSQSKNTSDLKVLPL